MTPKLQLGLTFDIRGNLFPHKKNTIPLEEFETVFVKPFPENSSRHQLFQNYLRFLKDFKNEVTPEFIHWIDGSFVSNKNNPGDIDFVTLIDFEIAKEKRDIIDSKFRFSGVKTEYKVDAYAVQVYPENHEKYWISKSETLYWMHWFEKTKPNRNKKRFKKGFIEIKINTYGKYN